MKKIALTQNQFALVDDEDYEFLNQWKWHAHKPGKTFYALRSIQQNGKRTTIRMHRVIAERMGIKGMADHKNRNGLDNQRNNLRSATHKQNCENKSLSKRNTSGHMGVTWDKYDLKWSADIGHNGQVFHLGLFDKIEDAVKKRKEAENKYFTHHRSS